MEYIHKPKYIAAIVVADVMFVIAMIMNGLAGSGGRSGGLFERSTGNVSADFPTLITPAGWTFSIWGLIYAWQAAWLIYGLTTIWRRTSYGYLYIAPGHMHPSLYLVFAFNLATNIAWLLIWDRELINWALAVLLMTTASLYTCLMITWVRVTVRGPVLEREEYKYEVWLARGLVQNGLGLYAAWVTVASLVNLAASLQYSTSLSATLSATISLGILLVIIIAWFFVDNFVWNAYTAYTFTPYGLFIFALTGVLARNWDPQSSVSVMVVFILVTACVAVLLKAAIFLFRRMQGPILHTERNTFFSSQSFYGSTTKEKVPYSADDKESS